MTLALDALIAGSAVLIAASGLIIAYGWFRLINMAHGDLMMVGAYCCALLSAQGLPFWQAVAGAGLVVGAIFLLVDLAVLRRLRTRGQLAGLLATWGVGLALSELIRLILGPGGRFVDPPTSRVATFAGAGTPLFHLVLVAVAALLLVAGYMVMRWTRLGLILRATLSNSLAAQNSGIDTSRLMSLGMLVSGALAGAAGALLAPLNPVTPNLSLVYAPTAFIVVILGGRVAGAGQVLAALFVGGSRTIFQTWLDPASATVASMLAALGAIYLLQLRRSRQWA